MSFVPALATTLTFLNPIVVDGDTFKHGNDRVRLWGIDAPEMSTPEGIVAKNELRYMIENKNIMCEQKSVDNYGRIVAQCWTEDEEDLACSMVAMGAAEDWSYFSHGYYKECE